MSSVRGYTAYSISQQFAAGETLSWRTAKIRFRFVKKRRLLVLVVPPCYRRHRRGESHVSNAERRGDVQGAVAAESYYQGGKVFVLFPHVSPKQQTPVVQ